MINKYLTYISGVLAVGIYISLIGVLVFYFNTHEQSKPKHFVKKNEERIRISISTPTDLSTKTPNQSVKKHETSKSVKKVVKKESVKKEKTVKKKVIKEKVVKKPIEAQKKEPKPKTVKKINKPKSLFDNVKTKKQRTEPKKVIKKKDIPKKSNISTNTHKEQTHTDRGIENAYLAGIEEKLKGWPAQSEYAGEEAKVWFKIETSGKFIFKVVTRSGNIDFNDGLVTYLKQLQNFGFGKHSGARAYEIDVKFVATE